MIQFFYETIMSLGVYLIEFILLLRTLRGKEDPMRLNERRGIAKLPRPEGALIWLHASSVGESIASLTLIEKLLESRPNYNILITTGSISSAKLLEERLPKCVIHQFIPIDRKHWVQRFLNHWQPNLTILMESEFWPTQIKQLKKRNTPILVINARLSESSYSQWRLAGSMTRTIFGNLDLVLATNDQQARRFSNLGAPYVLVAGNLKRSAPRLPLDADSAQDIIKQVGSRPVWLAASTHEGEDLPILKTQKKLLIQFPNMLTIIVPRHSKRGVDIEYLAKKIDLSVARRNKGEQIKPETELYIADTMGEMSLFYNVAHYVFIAGSLVPVGGHNPIEAAHFNCAIFFGPLMAKNQEISEEMIEKNAAIQIDSIENLTPTLERVFGDDDLYQSLSYNAQEYAENGGGILEIISTKISPYIKKIE